MNWSLLRKQIRSLICDELRDRVDFHKAVYRKSWESLYDRAWITVDGEEVFEVSQGAYTMVWRNAMQAAALRHPEADRYAIRDLANIATADSPVESTCFLSQSLRFYLESPLAGSLQSDNPVIRAFAMIDRRTGKRALARVTLAPEAHPLVRAFYELRTVARFDKVEPVGFDRH